MFAVTLAAMQPVKCLNLGMLACLVFQWSLVQSSNLLHQPNATQISFRYGIAALDFHSRRAIEGISKYREWQTSMFVMSQQLYIPDRSYVFDIFGDGVSLASLVKTHDSKIIVSLCYQNEHAILLQRTVELNKFNRSIIVVANRHGGLTVDNAWYIASPETSGTISSVYYMLERSCPSVIKFDGDIVEIDEFVAALLSSLHIIKHCKPILYIVISDAESQLLVDELLSIYGYPILFLHAPYPISREGTPITITSEESVYNVVVAIPDTVETGESYLKYIIDSFELKPYQTYNASVCQAQFGTEPATAIEEVSSCHTRLKVKLGLAYSDHISSSHQSDAHELHRCISENANLHHSDVWFPTLPSAAAKSAWVSAKCYMFVNRLFTGTEQCLLALSKHGAEVNVNGSATDVSLLLLHRAAAESRAILQSCEAFALKQLSFLSEQLEVEQAGALEALVQLKRTRIHEQAETTSVAQETEAQAEAQAGENCAPEDAIEYSQQPADKISNEKVTAEAELNPSLSATPPPPPPPPPPPIAISQETENLVFNLTAGGVFDFRFDESICSEPIWCDHTVEFQRRLLAWQNPSAPTVGTVGRHGRSDKSCDNAKYLIFQPPSSSHGIGAIVNLVAVAFRHALCLGRVLVLATDERPSLSKWRHPGCRGSTLECYFLPLSDCVLPSALREQAVQVSGNDDLSEYPWRDQRILSLTDFPSVGKCTICGDSWNGDISFFDGLFLGRHGYIVRGVDDKSIFTGVDDAASSLRHFSEFLGSSKQTWLAQFVRYILRPRRWFAQAVQQAAVRRLRVPISAEFMHGSKGPSHSISNTTSTSTASSDKYKKTTSPNPDESEFDKDGPAAEVVGVPVRVIPRPFVSLHVRYGTKAVEVARQPLERYMRTIQAKLPGVCNVFVSTESDWVIRDLIKQYPHHKFYYLNYNRSEYLNISETHDSDHSGHSFVDEWLYSFANLFVASEADFFIGSLTSSWCSMISSLERTRGDGGADYWSVDAGSAFSRCF